MSRGALARVAAVALAGALLGAVAAGAQPPDSLGHALEGRIVRHIAIVSHTIFDPPPPHASALYSVANNLHVRTKHATVRGSLVLREREPWTEARRAESERHLRALAFLIPDSVSGTPVGRDSVDVRVVTHDNWTTSPEFGIESGGGQHYASFSFIERNFLGLGTSLGLGYRSDVNGISRSATIEDGTLFGSHWHARLATGNGSSGPSSAAMLLLPFWSDDAKLSLGGTYQQARLETDLFAGGAPVAHVSTRETRADALWGLGRRDGDLVRRAIFSFEIRDRTLSPTVAFANAPTAFIRPGEVVHTRRLAVEGRISRPHYIVRHFVDQIDRAEDFDVGPALHLKAGYAPTALGSTANEFYAHVRAETGADAGAFGFGTVRVIASSSLRPSPHEEQLEFGTRWVQQPGDRWTAVVALTGQAGRQMQADYQLTLGGLNGLRAFPVHELTGTGAWRANAEMRWVGFRDLLELVSVGAAAFWDAGRTSGPGSDDRGWHHDAGFGLRLSLPHSALNAVARFDVAWPLSPLRDGRHGAAYSFGSGQAF